MPDGTIRVTRHTSRVCALFGIRSFLWTVRQRHSAGATLALSWAFRLAFLAMVPISRTPAYHAYLQSHEWKALRRQVLGRAQGVCELCGQRRARHIHHLHYRTFTTEQLTDLLAVCLPCHQIVHGRHRRSRAPRQRSQARRVRALARLKALETTGAVPPHMRPRHALSLIHI